MDDSDNSKTTTVVTAAKQRIDEFQRRHSAVGFIYGVIKKFGDDKGTQLAALCTYYGFFSLFPLLLAAYTILGFVLADNDELRHRIGESLTQHLPISIDAKTIAGSGLALVIGVVLALWSGLGATQVAQEAMAVVWDITRENRASFVMKKIRGLVTLSVVGLGVVAASAASSVVTFLGPAAQVGGYFAAVIVNSVVIAGLFRLLTHEKLTLAQLWPGAVFGGVLWTFLHVIGGVYTQRLIQNSDKTYGTFATVIGLLSWIFLLSQAFVYAAEVSTVSSRRLWPRAIDPTHPTDADRAVAAAIAQRDVPLAGQDQAAVK